MPPSCVPYPASDTLRSDAFFATSILDSSGLRGGHLPGRHRASAAVSTSTASGWWSPPVCTYLVGYRFYGNFIAARVMALDDRRATPAERLRDGHDFEPTNKWIVFGHHFAAIAGPGPLVGPDAGRAVRLSAGSALDHHRRGAGRRGAGLRDPVLLPCGATANRWARWRAKRSARWAASSALVTRAADHDHPAGGGRRWWW